MNKMIKIEVKKVVVDIPIFDKVKVGTTQEIQYVCSDNKSFSTESEAMQHEKGLKKDEIIKQTWKELEQFEQFDENAVEFDNLFGFSLYDTQFSKWFKFKNQEEIKNFVDLMKIIFTKFENELNSLILKNCPQNEWVFILLQDNLSGDYSDAYDTNAVCLPKSKIELVLKTMIKSIPDN